MSKPVSETITWAKTSLTPGMVISRWTFSRKGSRNPPSSASTVEMACSMAAT